MVTWQYWAPAAGDPLSGTLIGNAWQIGAPGAYSPLAGYWPCSQNFLYFGSTGLGLNLHMEGCGQGCPPANATLAVLAQQAVDLPNGGPVGFLLATAAETPVAGVNWDYSTEPHQLVRLPTPVVVDSCAQCPPGNVTLTVSVPSVAAGLSGPSVGATFTGYRILSAVSATDPGNDASAYTIATTIPAPGGMAAQSNPFTISCPTTGGGDAWIATQLSFENGAIQSQLVSEPRRIHCAGLLAVPKFWKFERIQELFF
jgi:hypothetical protein